MKKIVFLLILFPTIFCSGCKKEDLTDTTDITQYSWKVKSITINGNKENRPKKDCHNEKLPDNDYALNFQDDSLFTLYLNDNNLKGIISIQEIGIISFNKGGITLIGCESKFSYQLIEIITKITTYQVLSNCLILKGSDIEIEFEKEK